MIHHTLRHLAVGLALFLVGGAAHAQTVSLTFSGTEPHAINSQWQVLVNYNLPAGAYSNLQIELTMPDAATHPVLQLINQAAASEWTYTNQTLSPTQQRLVWTLPSLSTPQAISGQFVVTVKAPTAAWMNNTYYYTKPGTPFPFTARLTGNSGAFDVTDSATRTVTGAPTINWQYTLSPYRSFTTTIGGQPSIVMRYNLRAYVCGNAATEGFDGTNYGLGFRVNLGSGLHFLNAWWGDNNGTWPGSNFTGPEASVLSTPTAYGQVGHAPGGAITARWNSPLAPSENSCAYTYNFYVDVAYPCSEGPWNYALPAFQMSVDDPTAGASGTQARAFWKDFAGAVTTLQLPVISEYNGNGFTECGGNAGVAKYWDGAASPGAMVAWALVFTPPYGATLDAGTVIVDKLPPVTNPVEDLLAYKDTNPGLSAAQYYWCNLSAEVPAVDYFTGSQLQAYIGAGKCQLGVTPPGNPTGTRPPDGMSPVTHYAILLPTTTGQASSYPTQDGMPVSMSFYVYTRIPTGQTTDYVNCTQLIGSYDNNAGQMGTDLTQESPSGSEPNDPWEDCATKTIPTVACPYPYTDPSWFTTTLAPGQCRHWYFYPWRYEQALLPLNPTYRVTVPAGIKVMDVASVPYAESQPDGTQVYGTCGAQSLPAISVVTPEPFPSAVTTAPTAIDISFGSSANPCTLEYSYSNYFAINFCVDDQQAWANGQALEVKVEATGAANGPSDWDAQCGAIVSAKSRSVNFVLAVPPEMRAFVSPSCGPGGAPSFVVEGKNTGGVNLTEADLVFAIPAGTTLTSAQVLEAPAGALLEMANSASGPWVPVAASGTATHVKLSLPSGVVLPPVSNNRMSFEVVLAGGTNGSDLTATGTLSANPLAEPAVGSGTFTVGSCVPVTIQKFWDIDFDGVRDANEPGLSGWVFEVTTSLGGLVAQPVTDTTGEVTLQVPAGTYSVAEQIPPSPSPFTPDWVPTTGGPSEPLIIAVGSGPQTLTFGNACGCPENTDNDLCTERLCVRVANDEVVDIKDFACTDETPIDCDGNACTTQVCDPAIGCVEGSSSASPCEDEVVYFLPIRDGTNGLVAAIRCVVPTDGSAPSCDTDAGQLVLYPDQGGACGGAVP